MQQLVSYLLKIRIFRYQKIRFLFSGGICTVFDFAIFNLIIFITHAHSIVANTLSVMVAMCLSYYLNHFFVFQSKRAVTLKGILIFMTSTGLVLLLTQNGAIALALYVFSHYPDLFSFTGLVSRDTIEANVAKLIAVLISMVVNFIIYKYVIFNTRSHKSNNKTNSEAA